MGLDGMSWGDGGGWGSLFEIWINKDCEPEACGDLKYVRWRNIIVLELAMRWKDGTRIYFGVPTLAELCGPAMT